MDLCWKMALESKTHLFATRKHFCDRSNGALKAPRPYSPF